MSTVSVKLLGMPARSLALKAVSGEVVDIQKSSETKISSSGSGFINQATGSIVLPPIKSSTTHIDTLFIRGVDGQETSLEIVDSGVPVRPGSKVSIVYATEDLNAARKQVLVGLVNHDTNATARVGLARDICQALDIKGNGDDKLTMVMLFAGGLVGALITQHWGGLIGGAIVGFLLILPIVFPAFVKAMRKMESDLQEKLQSVVDAGFPE